MNSQYSIYPDVTKEVQRTLQARINMFQLIHPKKLNFNHKIMGPVNVRITEIDNEVGGVISGRQNLDVKWLTGAEAYVEYERINNEGMGVAWMPDDYYWRNRVMIMNDRFLLSTVSQLRCWDNSIKTGNEVLMEIKCLESVVKKPTKIWKVFVDGQDKDFFMTKEDAESFVLDQKSPTLITDSSMKIGVGHKATHKYEIRETTKLEYTEEIKKLIKENQNRFQFGWTQSEYFEKVVKPEVYKMIKEERAKMIAGSKDAFVIQPEELAKLRKLAQVTANITAEDMERLVKNAEEKKEEANTTFYPINSKNKITATGAPHA